MLVALFDDKYAGFIAACYGVSFFVLAALSLYIVLDLKKQWRALRSLEAETGKQRWS